MKGMPNMTLSLTKEDQDKIRKIAEQERRSISQQVVIMTEFYLKNKK